MKSLRWLKLGMVAAVWCGGFGFGLTPVYGEIVRVSVESVGGQTFSTPVFAGIHDGSFDLFDAGSPASAAVEALSEDGNNSVLGTVFADAGFVGGNVGGGPLGPGATASTDFTIELDGSERLVLATMVLPTNDWFLSAADSDAFSLADLADGPLTFDLNRLYDAGTELNDFDFSAGNPLLNVPGGQTAMNQGVDENGSIQFLGLVGPNGELTATTGDVIANPFADFENLPPGFNPALSSLRVTVSTVSAVPEPTSMAAMALIGGMGFVRSRRKFRRRRLQSSMA